MTDDQYGITTSLFARAAATADDRPEEDEERDESIEVPADKEGTHPARPAVKFEHHRQEGNREVVRKFPTNLKTNALRSGRRSK